MLSLLLAVALLQAPAAGPASSPAATPGAAPAATARPSRGAGKVAPVEDPVLKGSWRPTGKTFTGDLDHAEVDEAIGRMVKAAGLSVVFPAGHRHERVTASFKDAPVEEALRAVLLQAGLVAERRGSIVIIGSGERAEPEAGAARHERPKAGIQGAERRGRDGRDRVVNGDAVVRSGDDVRDVVAIRGNVKLESGAQARDVVAVLGSVSLEAGARARQAVAIAGDLDVGPGAVIARDAVSVGGEVRSDPSADIGGETTSVGIPDLGGLAGAVGSHSILGRARSPVWAIGQALARFVVFYVLALALLALFPRRVDAVAAGFAAHPWKSVLAGLLGLVATPIVVVLLVATIIGIPLVAVAALALLGAGILGFTALSAHLGRALPVRVQRNAQALQLAMGTAIVVVITSIPVLGCLAYVAAGLLTFGAVLRTRFGSQDPALATTVAPPPAGPPPAAPA